MKLTVYKHTFLTVVISLTLLACQSLKTAVFDQYSYHQAISIKVESGHLMDKAVEPYATHQEEVNDMQLTLQKLVEYEKNKPHNEVSYAMWNMLANPEKNSLAGFFKRWEDEETLSQVFVDEAKIQVMEALDLIIKYEAQKNKTNETNILNFLTSN